MFEYSQSTGIFSQDGKQLAVGYSGNGVGLNQPNAQMIHNVGPIPQGSYTIAPPHADEKVGPVAMRLSPAPGNEMFNRGDFLIHGPHANDQHNSSEGCIIIEHNVRCQIGEYVLGGDNQLIVTS